MIIIRFIGFIIKVIAFIGFVIIGLISSIVGAAVLFLKHIPLSWRDIVLRRVEPIDLSELRVEDSQEIDLPIAAIPYVDKHGST